MTDTFFDRPILNSPYEYPSRHWELDDSRQPTNRILEHRRRVSFITPIPAPKKRKRGQQELIFDDAARQLGTENQQYKLMETINDLRREVDGWRQIADPGQWRVTPETARLLKHWRHHAFSNLRPFFCQVEAAETVIWLTEVAPGLGRRGRRFLDDLADANEQANPGLSRMALKLDTGAGKTTVMAMLIAWQTINAVRRRGSRRFTRGFLVVTPGITVRDRLRVLRPNDPDSYYASRELVPGDMLEDLQRTRIVITNYHALRRRERLDVSSGGRALLQGPGAPLETLESEGQMVQRVMPELMSVKNVMVLNDEGHHCYRRKPGDDDDEGPLTREDRREADHNNEEARVWISGLEMAQRKLGVLQIVDLSATPFFLRGSGYAEGTLFPWTVNDFSLMDAIECGIVKLPRVPVADDIPGEQVPVFRNLWEHIRNDMPRAGRSRAGNLDPLDLPTTLQTVLQALLSHDCGKLKFKEMLAAGRSFDDLDLIRSWDYGRDVSFDRIRRPTENIARRLSEEYADHLVGQHQRQGEGMMKFMAFQRGLCENQQKLTQREQHLLFLEHESHLSEEGRDHYLQVLEHERQFRSQYYRGPLNSNDPASAPEGLDPD